MEAEPHDAITNRAVEFVALIADPDQFDTILAMLADNFVREDRRRFVSTGTVDRDGYIDGLRSWLELADGDPHWNLERVLATRGDHAGIGLVSVTYDDGSRTEILTLVQLDEADGRWSRFVYFDPDDVDTALEALAHLATDTSS